MRERDDVAYGAGGLRQHLLVVEGGRYGDRVARFQDRVSRRARGDVKDLVAEQTHRTDLRFGICSNLILETLIDADGDLEIPRRVRVDWQKVDSLHRARELASESDCTAHAQAVCLLQEREVLALDALVFSIVRLNWPW